MARGWKFWTLKVELYYPCREKIGADQLRSNHEADLHLNFRICKTLFSHDASHQGAYIGRISVE